MDSNLGNGAVEGSFEMPADWREADQIFSNLSHDIRQPLSCIENIAYYLEMILANADQEVLDHCAELRRLVEESSWLLDDAALSMKLRACHLEPVAANVLLEGMAARMALHEERNIELIVEPELPRIMAPAKLAQQFFSHILEFFRSVALSADPMRIALGREQGFVRLSVQGNVGPEPGELRKAIDPSPQGNGVRRFMEAAGGSLTMEIEGESLKAVFLFQPCKEAP